MQSNNYIAAEILNQLGGNRFVAMVGAKDFSVSESAVSFKIGSNSKKIFAVRIALTAMDDYKVSFYKWTNKSKAEFCEEGFEGIYCGQLQEVFEHATGMVVSL